MIKRDLAEAIAFHSDERGIDARGAASGCVFNYFDTRRWQGRFRSKVEIVDIAQELGFDVDAHPRGAGRRGRTIVETLKNPCG